MSLYDYRMSLELSKADPPFYALIMAAMRKADTGNMEWLRRGFSGTYDELLQRYHAPGGLLPGETELEALEE